MGVYVLSKPIKKGMELLISYGKGFWAARKVENKEEDVESEGLSEQISSLELSAVTH